MSDAARAASSAHAPGLPWAEDRREWAVWEGVEVEGRFAGLRTVFVGARCSHLMLREAARRAPHLYVNPDFIEASGYDAVAAVLAGDAPPLITLSLTPALLAHCPEYVLARVHIMLVLPAGRAALRLKPSDTVRLDAAPYRVGCASARAFAFTAPADYQADTPLLPAAPPTR